jgi:hypothetical protein
MEVEFIADVKPEYLEYLDDLRASGVTNMFGAAPYITETFGLTQKESRAVLLYWMTTFSKRHPQREEKQK